MFFKVPFDGRILKGQDMTPQFHRVVPGYYKSNCGRYMISRVEVDGIRWNLVEVAQSEWGVDEWIECFGTLKEAQQAACRHAGGKA